MPSNYDNAAWFYDRLSRLVYGQTLVKAQTCFLHLIPPNSKILIVGGGTGWIIEEVSKIHPSGLIITYVELSANMMALSKKKDHAANIVNYINLPVEQASLLPDFDVMITPFLFDNFSPDNFLKIFNQLHRLLQPGGLWFNIDFQLTGKWWQKPLLNSMYLFFKILGCMEASHLSDTDAKFIAIGYQPITEKNFFGDFIGSSVYKK